MSETKASPVGPDYRVPTGACEIEYEIKKSRFIARAALASSRAEALAHLAQARLQYPDARHHCWAYLLGNPYSASSAAMSDDGEPAGTAGKPILNVLQHKGVGDIMLIVTRYFGGIKLGAGGLVRAYSRAAQQAMDALETVQQVPTQELTVHCDFALEQNIRHHLNVHQGSINDCSYSQEVCIDLSLPLDQVPSFLAYLQSTKARYKAE